MQAWNGDCLEYNWKVFDSLEEKKHKMEGY